MHTKYNDRKNVYTVTFPIFLKNNNSVILFVLILSVLIEQCILYILHINIQYTFCKW